MESLHDLEVLVESKKTGLVVIETEREGCFIEGFQRIAARSTVAYFHWTVTKGLLRLGSGYKHQSHNRDINQLFAQIQSTDFPSVYVLVDFHHFLQDPVAKGGGWFSVDWFFYKQLEFRADLLMRYNEPLTIMSQLHFYL